MPRNITLPPLTDYVSLADVPLLLAQSIERKDCEDPELFQAFDAIAYEKEVKDAVLWGQLLPRSPDTLIPIPQACGEQLRTAVVTVANLAEFVKQRYEGLVQVEGGTTGERIMAQEATKKENGRYTLVEAAAMLAEHAGMRLESTLSKLIEAVGREELPVYEPGRNETHRPQVVRDNYEEAYWNDLNAWLSDNEARISWKFPSPSPEPTPQSNLTTHKLKTRTNILDAAINQAKKAAIDPDDWQSVWAALVALAESKIRPSPLMGFSEEEGVKYQDYGGVRFLSKKNFSDRFRRANTR